MWTGLLLKQNKTQTSWEINKTGRKSVWLSPAIFWPLNNDFCPPTNQISTIFSLWKWNNQHITSVGERKNPSLRQDSNLWPPKHRAGALPSELRRTHGQRGHILGSYLTRVLHTARISSIGFKACITILGGLEGFLHEFEMASKSHKLANPVTSST